MEELSIEEKAKAYDEAIERARLINNKGTWVRCGSTGPSICEQIFPELKESEDDKTREQVIYAINQLHVCECTKNRLLAWLKKQGEHAIRWNKNTNDNKPQKNHSVLIKTTHGIAEGEWQGEQWYQYRWTSIIRDSDVLSWIELSDLEKQGEQNNDKIVEKAKTEKQRVLLTETNGSANIDWDCRSLDDVKTLLKCGFEFIRTIETNKQILPDSRFGGCSISVPTRYNKDIKQGEQKPVEPQQDMLSQEQYAKAVDECIYGEQKPAWSEEDNQIALSIEQVMNCASLLNIVPEKMDKIRTWLKSLKDRVGNFDDGYKVGFSAAKHNQWEPSDEQMHILYKYAEQNNYDGSVLTSLYQDLKKLMKE